MRLIYKLILRLMEAIINTLDRCKPKKEHFHRFEPYGNKKGSGLKCSCGSRIWTSK